MSLFNIPVPSCRTRKEYSEFCKFGITEAKLSVESPILLQYRRDGNNQLIGAVVAFMYNGYIHVGASKCNRKLHDKFDKYIGIFNALNYAVPISISFPETMQELHDGPVAISDLFNEAFPLSMHKLVCRMIFRARRHFAPKSVDATAMALAA